MNTKLMKYEFRATARIFLPLLGAAAALSALSWISLQLGGAGPAAHMGMLHKIFAAAGGLLSACTFLSLVALMVCCVLVTVQRFYRNILGDEGYLMLTLPATPTQHIAAKLAAGTVWTIAALAVALGAAAALGTAAVEVTADGAVSHLTLAQAAAEFEARYAIELWRVAGLAGLLFITGVVNTYLLAYLCMALGSRWPQQRLAASIGVFVAVDFARRIVWLLVLSLSGNLVGRLAPQLFAERAAPQIPTFCAIIFGMLVLEAAAYFLAARRLLTKRLNLA